MGEFRYQRDQLVRDLADRGIADHRVLTAMGKVPREQFVEEHLRRQAYHDGALPIKEGQTISQPYIVARMTELLEVGAECSVLEIGTGSGYQTAILAELARVVFSIERIAALARDAIARIRRLGYTNVKIHVFDGTVGLSEAAPYDRILVTAAAPSTPKRLLEQLAPGGRLVAPIGDLATQRLVLFQKNRRGGLTQRHGEAVAFVPLIGRDGWEAV